MLKFSVSLILLISCLAVSAQFDPVPRSFKLGTDLTNIGYSLFADQWTQYELNTDVEISNFFLVFDYGVMDRTWDDSTYTYQANGSYFRIGIDHNFFYKKDGEDVFLFGLRYGSSSYSDEMNWSVTDQYWGPVNATNSNSNLRASWFELVTGLKVQIWKELFLGMTGRLKIKQGVSGEDNLISFEIPGYGRASSVSYWGFNYHVFWRFPLRKEKVSRGD